MSAERIPDAAADLTALAVDEHNPWLGLASFTEETREYFYGREDEVAELARRVQRKLLTVLFGQSGLGKTSILRAGLVPRLRGQGYCPIYVRIDYAREAPEPAEQIKQAIQRTARRSGRWTQSGVAVAGETLWEFLHHRDDVLRDDAGATLIPLLIFDQFEEIFTLAQSDDAGRARAQRFIADLADLVENRPPKEVEARLESDETAAEQFDFARSDYRVLIALREDYLAPLEGLKSAMPSITQNRLRLAPMTGQQALAAVMRPGKRLVTEEVAAAIVRFVAGGAELANAEVEPSLLSLICRELNDTRLAQGKGEISLDLLAGSHESILSNFYERSLADQPPAVRRAIEDELLTESGFRENVAEERMLKSLAAAGAGPATLATLVNRRLLRIEERLDVRRVELTHDVLCSVVKASRDLRKEREARDATERMLAAQREREQAARRSLVRARQVAAVCSALALGALLAAGLAYVSTQRAHRAERAAQEARVAADETSILAEQARGQAEQLLGYLTEDFSRELEGFGRLDLVAELAEREVAYFKALPPALRGGDTTRNGALAMLYDAKAKRSLGKTDEALAAATEGLRLLEGLKAAGDASEATTVGIGFGLLVQGLALENRQSPEALPTFQKSIDYLKPVAEAEHSSLAVRRVYVQPLERAGRLQMYAEQLDDAYAKLDAGLRILRRPDSGALDLRNPDMTAYYVILASWQVNSLALLGRPDDARRLGAEAAPIAARLLAERPNHLLALRATQLIGSSLGVLALDEMRDADAATVTRRSTAASRTLSRLDPGNIVPYNNLVADLGTWSQAAWQNGRPREALALFQSGADARRHMTRAGAGFLSTTLNFQSGGAAWAADLGDLAAARELNLLNERDLLELRRIERVNLQLVSFGECTAAWGRSAVALWSGDFATARRLGRDCIERMRALKPQTAEQEFWRNSSIFYPGVLAAQAELRLGDQVAAEQILREALAARSRWPVHSNGDRREQADAQTWLAISLARQGKTAEAASTIAPVVKLHRELATRNHDDELQHLQLAAALYAESLASKERHDELIREAAALVAALPGEMRGLRSVAVWTQWIRAESRGAG